MFTAIQRQQMLAIARDAINHGCETNELLTVTYDDYSAQLLAHHACFVTVSNDGVLRGCMGSLSAQEPLVDNIAANAFKAAFRDPRFDQLDERELGYIDIEIAVLSPRVAIESDCEEDLIAQLRPNLDGVLIEEGELSATFLPNTWQQLPDRKEFFRQLKLQAGLAEDYWSESIRVERYSVETISKRPRSA